MTRALLIHEKCNEDVRVILDSFSRRSRDEKETRKNFLSRLVEAYQNIYENFPAGETLGMNLGRPYYEHIERYFHRVQDFFGVLVIYTKLKSGSIVILGVISLESYYRLQREDYLNEFKARLSKAK